MDLMELYKNLKDDNALHQETEIAQNQINALDDQAPTRAPVSPPARFIKINDGDLDGAGNDIKEALAINPDDPKVCNLNGDLLMKLGRTDDAIAVYKKIIAIDPGQPLRPHLAGLCFPRSRTRPGCGEIFPAA